jgi:hypothetical protein
VDYREGQELLTLLVTQKKKKKDKVEVKAGNSLCKLGFAFPFIIYFLIFCLPPNKKESKFKIKFTAFWGQNYPLNSKTIVEIKKYKIILLEL